MKSKTTARKRLPKLPSAAAWEKAWQKHWSKVGTSGYELPASRPDKADREFLTQARTVDQERARLKRINDEFVRAFRALYPVGPAVTGFARSRAITGSSRAVITKAGRKMATVATTAPGTPRRR